MDTRREFIKKASLLSGGAGLFNALPASIQKALAIDPAIGSTYLDAEHIVLLMQENRSFDHTFGTLQGVRGFNDPRAITLPNKNLVWLQTNKEGETYCPFHLDIKNTKSTWMSSLPHTWSNQVDARNNGKYDKWLDSKHSGNESYAAMPLTLGHYSRNDIPFYYSLADAFTVCDQHFCSSLTGTTANRLFFWTGTIRNKQEESAVANVWNEDTDYDSPASWTTFPERLQDNGISWKIYQNELDLDTGFEGEEGPWLGNFGDNPIEYFTQYNVKFSPEYIAHLPKAEQKLAHQIKTREQKLSSATGDEAKKLSSELEQLKKALIINQNDQKVYTLEKFEQLTQREKDLHRKAFSNNRKDPSYHQLTTLKYDDNGTPRELKVPKGDILHEFREDVKNGSLPTVSWIVAPENFSDHPSSAWYGAWYISEVMDILTHNPEVWKKTIFILTYDENDGYFDHVPPFVAPHPHKKDTGRTSAGIETGVDYVSDKSQQTIQDHARESPIGLGYRVPMVIASPWSRGGWVCSQVFDHTSSLQFLEKFLGNKTGKKIEESNISKWRRTVCGDLASAFRPYLGEKINLPVFVKRDEFIKSIHKAKFKRIPSNYTSLTAKQVATINKSPHSNAFLPVQEPGIRSSCAIPYELYADGNLDAEKGSFSIDLKSGNAVFGMNSAGSPFQVHAPGSYQQEQVRVWDYALAPGDSIRESWALNAFENSQYHLRVYGPNGFFREYSGDQSDPSLKIITEYDTSKKTPAIRLVIYNLGSKPLTIEFKDNGYKTGARPVIIPAAANGKPSYLSINTIKNYGWYDFSITVKENKVFEKRFAGRVENGDHKKTDPAMGRV